MPFHSWGVLIRAGGNMVGPHTLQHIQADATQLVDVGVEDLGQEADLGRDHGVVVGEKELELEGAACGLRG